MAFHNTLTEIEIATTKTQYANERTNNEIENENVGEYNEVKKRSSPTEPHFYNLYEGILVVKSETKNKLNVCKEEAAEAGEVNEEKKKKTQKREATFCKPIQRF